MAQESGFLRLRINGGSRDIGIDGCKNGVYLPRYASSCVPTLPYAPNHQGLHTSDYYFNVTMRLQPVSSASAAAGRTIQRSIAAELVGGIFPF